MERDIFKYQENRDDIIQNVEIDLAGISAQSRQDLESKLNHYLKHKDKSIFELGTEDKLVYKTEVLIPKINKNRQNILMVLGNPAVRSVAYGMFYSCEGAEGKWREHRFWRALRDCCVLEFMENIAQEKPTPENIGEINNYKQHCLLNGKYRSDFNIFLLPYFSFPTPGSGEYNGVTGIKKIVGKDIFNKMKEFEFKRFKEIVLCNGIKNVIGFQATAKEEILRNTQHTIINNILNYPVYKLGDAFENIILYTAPPTRFLHTNFGKNILKEIVAHIKKVG